MDPGWSRVGRGRCPRRRKQWGQGRKWRSALPGLSLSSLLPPSLFSISMAWPDSCPGLLFHPRTRTPAFSGSVHTSPCMGAQRVFLHPVLTPLLSCSHTYCGPPMPLGRRGNPSPSVWSGLVAQQSPKLRLPPCPLELWVPYTWCLLCHHHEHPGCLLSVSMSAATFGLFEIRVLVRALWGHPLQGRPPFSNA